MISVSGGRDQTLFHKKKKKCKREKGKTRLARSNFKRQEPPPKKGFKIHYVHYARYFNSRSSFCFAFLYIITFFFLPDRMHPATAGAASERISFLGPTRTLCGIRRRSIKSPPSRQILPGSRNNLAKSRKRERERYQTQGASVSLFFFLLLIERSTGDDIERELRFYG